MPPLRRANPVKTRGPRHTNTQNAGILGETRMHELAGRFAIRLQNYGVTTRRFSTLAKKSGNATQDCRRTAWGGLVGGES